MISIVPFEILVGMERAWKKEVFSGPRPVFCAGITTGHGAMAPALAGARTLFCNNLSLTSGSSPRVNTKPTFPLMCGRILWGKKSSFEFKYAKSQNVIDNLL